MNNEERQQLGVVDFDQAQIDLIGRQFMPGATHDDVAVFVATCRRTQLDPFAGQIWPMKRWSRENGDQWSSLVKIDGFRLVAGRSGEYQGQVGPFWCGPEGKWVDVWLDEFPPRAAKVGVWRANFREPIWGVALYASYVQKTREGSPNRTWKTMPDVMTAKVAEALALRKAFPNDLSGLYTNDEMDHLENDVVPPKTQTERRAPNARPRPTEQEMRWPAQPPRPSEPIPSSSPSGVEQPAAPQPAARSFDDALNKSSFEALSARLKAVPAYAGDGNSTKRVAWISAALGYTEPPKKIFQAYARADAAQLAQVTMKLEQLEAEAREAPETTREPGADDEATP